MEKKIAEYLLIVIFFIIYILIFNFIWDHLPAFSSIGVLLGSVIVLLISILLSIITTNKLIDVLSS